MMPRFHICDVPGCGGFRQRRQRLCRRCYARLPGDLKLGIGEAHHQRRNGDWNRLRREAASFLNIGHNPAIDAIDMKLREVPPERVFEMNQRLLVERSE